MLWCNLTWSQFVTCKPTGQFIALLRVATILLFLKGNGEPRPVDAEELAASFALAVNAFVQHYWTCLKDSSKANHLTCFYWEVSSCQAHMIVVFPKVLWTKKQRKPINMSCILFLSVFSCIKSQHLIVKDYEVTMDHQVEGSGHVALEDSGVNCGRLKPPCPSSTARRWCPDGMMISWIIFGLA